MIVKYMGHNICSQSAVLQAFANIIILFSH